MLFFLDDEMILDLLFARDELALEELKKKYGGKAKDPPPKSRRKNAN